MFGAIVFLFTKYVVLVHANSVKRAIMVSTLDVSTTRGE